MTFGLNNICSCSWRSYNNEEECVCKTLLLLSLLLFRKKRVPSFNYTLLVLTGYKSGLAHLCCYHLSRCHCTAHISLQNKTKQKK